MRLFRPFISFLITITLIYSLNRSWDFGSPIPPLGKFLDPFHGFWQNGERPLHSTKELTIPGLKEPVTILFDSAGIPHIFARNEEDLFFAQGYITARDRLWQMEFQVLAAGGRISEILGDKALDFDRNQRRIGMVYGAEQSLKGLKKDAKVFAAVQSYSNGVKAWISQLGYTDFPVEYKLLDYAPEPWSEMKVGLFFMNMAKTLNMTEHDFAMTNALSLFGKETLDILYPDHELTDAPIVDNPGGWKFKPITISDSVAPALPAELIKLKSPKERTPGVGSNNWVVSGSRTVTGSPILCNDPHLVLSMPSIWYVVHLNAPGINTMGASFPGAPCVILGFNDSIAWGCTNAQRDLVDWYKIKFKDKTKNEYLSDGQWKKTNKVIEKFAVKGATVFYDTIVFTHHGPIVYDESYHAGSEKNSYAYRWVSHDESQPLKAFYLLDHAKNFNDYSEALNYHHSPAQNFAFGSVAGDIAIRVQGKYPIRRKDEGKFALDGTLTSSDWQAFIPMEHNAVIKNPARGYLFSANQYPVDATYPYYIQTGDYYETYRNRRINQVLGSLSSATVKDLMKLHDDNFNWQASESINTMLSNLDSTGLSPAEEEFRKLLRNWDYLNTAESQAAIAYEAWWTEMYPMIWDEMKNDTAELARPSEYTTIRIIREKPDFPFFDLIGTPNKETLSDIMKLSFSAAVKSVEKWKEENKDKAFRWADYKDTYVQHLLRIPAFSEHAINGGNTGIVNASSHRWAPSWRMVVSLEKTGVKAWGVYPGGQSGNPGSPFYDNLLGRWSKGEYLKLQFVSSPGAIKEKAIMNMTLKP